MRLQVLHRMLTPLPAPETVARNPVRVLFEKASQRHCRLQFRVTRQPDKLYNVDVFVSLYLISR